MNEIESFGVNTPSSEEWSIISSSDIDERSTTSSTNGDLSTREDSHIDSTVDLSAKQDSVDPDTNTNYIEQLDSYIRSKSSDFFNTYLRSHLLFYKTKISTLNVQKKIEAWQKNQNQTNVYQFNENDLGFWDYYIYQSILFLEKNDEQLFYYILAFFLSMTVILVDIQRWNRPSVKPQTFNDKLYQFWDSVVYEKETSFWSNLGFPQKRKMKFNSQWILTKNYLKDGPVFLQNHLNLVWAKSGNWLDSLCSKLADLSNEYWPILKDSFKSHLLELSKQCQVFYNLSNDTASKLLIQLNNSSLTLKNFVKASAIETAKNSKLIWCIGKHHFHTVIWPVAIDSKLKFNQLSINVYRELKSLQKEIIQATSQIVC